MGPAVRDPDLVGAPIWVPDIETKKQMNTPRGANLCNISSLFISMHNEGINMS